MRLVKVEDLRKEIEIMSQQVWPIHVPCRFADDS